MKNFEDYGKKMPFNESNEYVDNLMASTTEYAIRQKRIRKSTRLQFPKVAAAVAAVVVITATAFWGGQKLYEKSNTAIAQTQSASPLDSFLSNISDDEAAQLYYYNIDEIAEY